MVFELNQQFKIVSANSITDQIARLETIATKLSRLIILQSGGEENHLDYSSGQGSPIVNNNNNKVLSILQPSTQYHKMGRCKKKKYTT